MLDKQFAITSFFSVLILVVVLISHLGHFFVLKKIHCSIDQQSVCPDYVQAELNKNIGMPIFFVTISQQLHKISGYLPSLHQFQFRQNLPNEMSVNFTSASPKYAVKLNSGSDLFIIDETGTVIDQVSQTSLPVMSIPDELYPALSLRSTLDSKLNIQLQSMFTELEKHQLSPTKITLLSGDELELELPDQKVAQLRVTNLAQEVDKLAYVMANVNFSSIKQPVKRIDVRFRYPILKT